MLGTTFYFSLTRKYISLFGTLFNDIQITREDSSGNVVGLLSVPISYSPKEKTYARYLNDPNIDRQSSITLPRISFELKSMKYDGDRKLNTIGKSGHQDSNSNKMMYQYNPVPYNLNFELAIYTKNAIDSNKILEQILPFFTPDWTPTVELIPEMGNYGKRDIPIILDSMELQDTYDGDFKERRMLIWILSFTMKGYFFGPIQKSGIIRFANTTFYIPSTNNIKDSVGVIPGAERVTVSPGLTANGEPTSNASLSIPRSQINADDDYGYITTIEML